MELKLSDHPSSFLTATLDEGEQIITEKGAFIYCEGEYSLQNIVEANSFKNWIAKIFGGKSLTYNCYTAASNIKLALAPKGNAEIFSIEIKDEMPVFFEPELHFARTKGISFQLESKSLKNTLNDGLKLKTKGSGELFLKGYGKIISQYLDTEMPIYVDENALIAYEGTLNVKTISKGVRQLLLSGEGFIFSITGKGKIWLQTREKSEHSNGGGLIDGVFSFVK